MITNSKLQVIPATSDNANLFLSLQPNSAGLTNTILSATALTYNPFSRTLSLNGIRWPASDGTAGQVLRTDGAGNLTFDFVGLVNFTDTLTLTGVNASVPVAALTATMNGPVSVDVVISPKGQGGILAQIPDGTTSGGNKRGNNAVDWQKSRTAANMVASGESSAIIGGVNNRASGTTSLAFGTNAEATSEYGIALGFNARAQGGVHSLAIGGNTSATASYSTAINAGNASASASANYAIAFGQNTVANGISSFATGNRSNTRSIDGYVAMSASNAPIADATGVQQTGLLILGRQTTTATPIVLTSNTAAASSTNQIALPANSAYYVRGSVIATVTGGGATKAWTFEVVIKKGAANANTSLVGTAIINITAADAGAATWAIGLTADTTNGALAVTVTGQVSNTIRWVCRAQTTEVTF